MPRLHHRALEDRRVQVSVSLFMQEVLKTHPDTASISSHSVLYLDPGSSGASNICFGGIYGNENLKMLKTARLQ